MKFDILTLFPEMFEAVLGTSILGRARKSGFIEMNFINIRDFSKDKHKRVDDYPYGGGAGMVMSVQPIYDAWGKACENVASLDAYAKPFTIYLSPQGKPINQALARNLAEKKHLILICGHYEGVDERVLEEIVDMEVSLGDFVLTGGEIPAMALVDCVARLVPGVLSEQVSYEDESHFNGLLEYPQYTRPAEWKGKSVPDILLGGHHARINKWRKLQSLYRTWLKRADMLRKADLSKHDKAFLERFKGVKRKGKKGFFEE